MGTPGLFVAFRLWLLNLVLSQIFSWIPIPNIYQNSKILVIGKATRQKKIQ